MPNYFFYSSCRASSQSDFLLSFFSFFSFFFLRFYLFFIFSLFLFLFIFSVWFSLFLLPSLVFFSFFLSYPNTLRWTWSSFWHSWNEPNGCKKVGMPMIGIHARFERFPTPYSCCDTSGHLSAFFHQENSRKCKTYWKPKQIGMLPWIVHTKSWKKLGPFQGCRETMCSQTEPSRLSEHPPFNMIYLDILEMTPTFTSRWECPL